MRTILAKMIRQMRAHKVTLLTLASALLCLTLNFAAVRRLSERTERLLRGRQVGRGIIWAPPPRGGEATRWGEHDGGKCALPANNATEPLSGMPPRPPNLQGRHYPSCSNEMSYELARDKRFAELTPETMPRPFPVETVPVNVETPEQCSYLQTFGGANKDIKNEPTVVVHIEVYKDVDMVKRVIRRLQKRWRHAFVIHLANDVGPEVTANITQLAESYSSGDTPICVVRGGYVLWLSATDMRILFSSMQWLLETSPHWDFFVSLSGADFPLMTGDRLNRELATVGPMSWASKDDRNNPPQNCGSDTLRPKGLFTKYRLTCEEEMKTQPRGGRQVWIHNLAPEMRCAKGLAISSGGIWHRRTVEFLTCDDRARAAFMYFRNHLAAAVEFYWQSVYTMPELNSTLVRRDSVAMFWDIPGQEGGARNAFLSMNEWDEYILPAIEANTPFIRKFKSREGREVLDRIEAYTKARAKDTI